MYDAPTRRQFLRTGIAAAATGLAGCEETVNRALPQRVSDAGDGGAGSAGPEDPPVDVRGAIYIPTRAFNYYQMWRDYDPEVIERDLGYAASVNLNAVRIWLSYGWWNDDPEGLEQSLEHLLSAASELGIRVLVGLFDAVGAEANSETLADTDIETATAVREPGKYVVHERDHWSGVRKYVDWFMSRWRDDDRLLAISVMNEPGWSDKEMEFARGMFREVEQRRGSVPLTVGSTSLINSADYVDWGVDIIQFHYNFPRNKRIIRDLLADANELSRQLDKPVWLTEWQRVRSSGAGFAAEIEGDEWQPKYASFAPTIREAGVGNFFWSLMVKPAWVPTQRELGAINGLFHEDGAVWSLDDARAIKAMSGDPDFSGEERKRRPEWMQIDDADEE